jgi:hypothetical protein
MIDQPPLAPSQIPHIVIEQGGGYRRVSDQRFKLFSGIGHRGFSHCIGPA